MTEEDLKMLFRMLIKLSEDCKIYGENNFSWGWDEHQEERKYFEKRLAELSDEEEE